MPDFILDWPSGFFIGRRRNAGAPTGVVFTDGLSDGAGAPVAITTTIATQAVWQRGRSTLTLAGTYDLSGDPTGMAWRVGSGDWVQLTSETIGSGNWTGTLDIPATYLAQGTLEVKPINGLSVTPATHSSVTVTDLMVVMGQSNADGAATSLQSYTKATFDFISASSSESFDATTTDPVMNSDGSHWPAFAENLDAAGVPPAIYGPVTIDGSGFANGLWNPGDGLYDTAVSRLNARLAETGGCALVHWVQGESDCNTEAAAIAWEAAFEAMVSGMVAEVTLLTGSTPWLITMVGEKGGAEGIDEWRASALSVINGNAWAYHGPNLINEVYGDGVHYGRAQGSLDAAAAEAQLDRIGAMTMRATSGVLYGDTSAAPAEITGYSVDDQHTITVTFDRAMQHHTDTTGWAVRSSTDGLLTIGSAQQGATNAEIVLEITENMSGTVSVSYGESEESSGGTLTDTHETQPMPPIYTYRATAGTGPFATGPFRPDDQAATTRWWTIRGGLERLYAGTVNGIANQIALASDLTKASESGSPAYGTRTLNGYLVADLDGVNDTMAAPQLTELPEFAIRAGNSTQYQGLLVPVGTATFTAAAASATARHGPGLWEVQFDATASTATLLHDGAQIAQATDYTGAQSGHAFIVIDIDGSSNANDGIVVNTSSLGFAIGRSDGAQYVDGGFAEAVVCNAVLSGADLTQMRAYLSATWGLGL